GQVVPTLSSQRWIAESPGSRSAAGRRGDWDRATRKPGIRGGKMGRNVVVAVRRDAVDGPAPGDGRLRGSPQPAVVEGGDARRWRRSRCRIGAHAAETVIVCCPGVAVRIQNQGAAREAALGWRLLRERREPGFRGGEALL